MLPDSAAAGRLMAYTLMEDAQGERHREALRGLESLEAQARDLGWDEVEFLAAAGQVLHGVVHDTDRTRVARAVRALTDRAEALGSPAMTALALALRGGSAGEHGDGAALLADVGQAVVLVDDDRLPAVDRCTVLVCCAAAYNSLSLWELVDELYDAASALAPLCELPVQEPAIAMNRILLRIEWATALLELGREERALAQLDRAAAAVEVAAATPGMPALWTLDIAVCRDLLAFVRTAHSENAAATTADEVTRWRTVLADHRTALVERDDVEVLPLLDAFVALSLFRLGRRSEAVEASRLLGTRGSSSSGASTFPVWVRAQVLGGDHANGNEAVAALQDYSLMVAQARWNARRGVLAAARSKIASATLGAEHAQLARDVLLDPLTGLSNRREFDTWLDATPGQVSVAALLLIDLDAFKVVNDMFGHAVGDEVLRRVADLLTGHVRSHDMALRLGGDEFAVLMTDEVGSADAQEKVEGLAVIAQQRARALQDAVGATAWDDVAPGLTVRASVGVATGLLGPEHPGGAERLYRAADDRLYDAKSQPAAEPSMRDETHQLSG